MSDSRTRILAKLDRVIDRKGAGQNDVDDRLAARVSGPVPMRGQDPGHAELLQRFASEAGLAGSDVHHLSSLDDVPATVADYLRSKNLPLHVRVSADEAFAGVSWDAEPSLAIESGRVDAEDGAAMTVAFGGVAETGTLIMASSPENPAMHGFVPLVHMVLLPESRVSGNYEAVWAELRDQLGPQAMPRMVNMITGPSRTADIEQTLLMGAHGPQSLMIMVVEGI
jgi:L-lactate dehydrogenase complex protein LldG